jgi:hypothetical protein
VGDQHIKNAISEEVSHKASRQEPRISFNAPRRWGPPIYYALHSICQYLRRKGPHTITPCAVLSLRYWTPHGDSTHNFRSGCTVGEKLGGCAQPNYRPALAQSAIPANVPVGTAIVSGPRMVRHRPMADRKFRDRLYTTDQQSLIARNVLCPTVHVKRQMPPVTDSASAFLGFIDFVRIMLEFNSDHRT